MKVIKMKEIDKPTKRFCIAWIFCTLTYLCMALFRSELYTSMIQNDHIEEQIIQRIDLLDKTIVMLRYGIIFLITGMILYLLLHLLHATLQKDCRFILVVYALCFTISYVCVFLFHIPKTTAFAPFAFLPEFLMLVIFLAFVNKMKKRYLSIHISNS